MCGGGTLAFPAAGKPGFCLVALTDDRGKAAAFRKRRLLRRLLLGWGKKCGLKGSNLSYHAEEQLTKYRIA